MRSRIFSALSMTGTAELFLLAVGGPAIAHQGITRAMRTINRDGDHDTLNFSTQRYPTLPYHSLFHYYPNPTTS